MINQKVRDEEDDEVHEEVVYGPEDEPWGCREIHVRDPSGHIIRFGQSIPAWEPKMEIDRVSVTAWIEKRLLALMEDLAVHKNMKIGEMLEETVLHSFEKMLEGGVASPHTQKTLAYI